MGRFDALATIVAVGPLAAAVRASLIAAPAAIERRAPILVAPSAIGADFAITRIAATSVEGLLACLRAQLDPLRTLLGDDPFARKW